MFDLLLTVLHFFLLAGLILVALIIRKRSKLILLLALLPATAQAIIALPGPGEGNLLWEGEALNYRLKVIQIPKEPRPYIPVTTFIQNIEQKEDFWDKIESIDGFLISNQISGMYSEKKIEWVQMGNEWSFIQKTYRMPGTYQLNLVLKENTGNTKTIPILFKVKEQKYLSFKNEMTLFIAGTIVLGILLFGLSYFLRLYDTKK